MKQNLTDFLANNAAGSLYNTEYVDFKKEPMFLGTGKNTQRFDDPKYVFFDNANDTMQGFDWKHDEIPLVKDKTDFRKKLNVIERFIVTKNYQKLIFLDSIQGRGPLMIFGQLTTLPELENVILTWEYFEGAKHSRTYTEQLRAFYDNPDEIFDESFNVPELMELASKITSVYDEAYFHTIEYIYKQQRNIPISKEEIHTLKKAMLMLMVEINILEGMRFYPGFASVWGLSESKQVLQGSTENLELICRDENEHLALTQFILKLMRKEEDEGFTEIWKELQPQIHERYIEAYYEEVDWIKFMFSTGSYIGMNDTILIQYLNYVTIRRMKSIGLHPNTEQLGQYIIKNPIPWINKYINMDKNEKLPQEEKITNYVTGGVEQDIEDLNDHDFMNKYI